MNGNDTCTTECRTRFFLVSYRLHLCVCPMCVACWDCCLIPIFTTINICKSREKYLSPRSNLRCDSGLWRIILPLVYPYLCTYLHIYTYNMYEHICIYIYICNIPLHFSFSDGISAARIYRRIEKKKTMRVKSSKFVRVRIAANSVSTARSRSRDFSAPPSVGWRHRRLLSYMSRRRQSSARFSTSLYLVHRMCISINKQEQCCLSRSLFRVLRNACSVCR